MHDFIQIAATKQQDAGKSRARYFMLFPTMSDSDWRQTHTPPPSAHNHEIRPRRQARSSDLTIYCRPPEHAPHDPPLWFPLKIACKPGERLSSCYYATTTIPSSNQSVLQGITLYFTVSSCCFAVRDVPSLVVFKIRIGTQVTCVGCDRQFESVLPRRQRFGFMAVEYGIQSNDVQCGSMFAKHPRGIG